MILESEAQRLETVRTKINAVRVAEGTEALLRLGQAIVEAYEAAKRARALLDYDDLILKTRDLLRRAGSAAWVHYKLDGGLEHILVDEAQDTNPEQWQVMSRLGRGIFCRRRRTDGATYDLCRGRCQAIDLLVPKRAEPAAFARMREHFQARARCGQPSVGAKSI